MTEPKKLTLSSNRPYWRSMNDLSQTKEFRTFVENEFPEGTVDLDGLSRRSFLSLMGASLALAGLAGCRRPVEKILPYVAAPEDILPGIPLTYASALPLGLDTAGILIENHEGRPTKIEGNDLHPGSRGKASAWTQAEILGLYDPDRSQRPARFGQETRWEEFLAYWKQVSSDAKAKQGEGLAILSGSFTSPTLRRLQAEFKTTFPKARWYTHEAVSDHNILAGLRRATRKPVQPVYHFEKADVILSLDSDFLLTERDAVRNAAGFAQRRRVENEQDDMNRLYVVESSMSVTGGMADHRLRLPSSLVGAFAAALVYRLQFLGLELPVVEAVMDYGHLKLNSDWVNEIATDLMFSQKRSIVIAGRHQPPEVHALVAGINEALYNIGETIEYYSTEDIQPDRPADIHDLQEHLFSGAVDTLICLDVNPVYTNSGTPSFLSALRKANHSIHLGMYRDETGAACEWHAPLAHPLESWGDLRYSDGSISIIQPQIQPLFGAKNAIEYVSTLIDPANVSAYSEVQKTFRSIIGKNNFESRWKKALHDGIVDRSKSVPIRATIKHPRLIAAVRGNPFPFPAQIKDRYELVIRPSASTYDGRFSNNGWLQELPDPVTKLTWDNAVLLSRSLAEELDVENQDVLRITVKGESIECPVWIMPGQADRTLTLELGFGRTHAGRIGNGVGVNVYPLFSQNGALISRKIRVEKTGEIRILACTQDHHGLDTEKLAADAIQKRLPAIYREATLEEYRANPDFVEEAVEHPPLKSLWDEPDYSQGPQWGMTIDLNVCTGCNACTIACQSENNIPIVGKSQVLKGREMHWLRLDRYYKGDFDNPEMVMEPVGCQQCENAPCEQVCPVGATTHTPDGLNAMAYNRCVGTRYCSNNCPYKVRRFNFFNYTKDTPEIVKMAMNPDVTVRFRGVMEKCTYCVQRINRGKITSKNEHRDLMDGDIISACQQTCPTDAIVFGDIRDPNSAVSRVKKQNRNYALLGEFNTKPRTTYLARLHNPNPRLKTES
ncbi:MAG: TAT-variant-translocated molybdopterin oxidoreductase [FCB group bacterium]|nr:TAT-variant-translocated molybdopterin oxidoreductase [FCB group bacterium]